jgi:hypothetical protein
MAKLHRVEQVPLILEYRVGNAQVPHDILLCTDRRIVRLLRRTGIQIHGWAWRNDSLLQTAASLLLGGQKDSVQDIVPANVSLPPPSLPNLISDNISLMLLGAENVVVGKLSKLAFVRQAKAHGDIARLHRRFEVQYIVVVLVVVSGDSGTLRQGRQAGKSKNRSDLHGSEKQ